MFTDSRSEKNEGVLNEMRLPGFQWHENMTPIPDTVLQENSAWWNWLRESSRTGEDVSVWAAPVRAPFKDEGLYGCSALEEGLWEAVNAWNQFHPLILKST